MPNEGGTRSRPAVRAALGAVCTSPMAIVVTLAGVGPVTTVVYRCGLALPVLGGLAVAEQRRRGSRPLVQTAGWLLITSSLPGLPAAVSSLLLLVQPSPWFWRSSSWASGRP
jgi:hypothetical protein